MAEYRRRATTAEKSMIAFNELRPPFAIQLVVQGEGAPEPDDLYAALEAATAANPGAALRLEAGEEAEDNWVAGPPPTLTVVDQPDFVGRSSDEEAPFLRWPMNAMTGPTCELVYVRGPTNNHLVFRALHAVMDGQGTLLWAKDVMRCLRGEAPVGHPSTLDVQTLCDPEKDNRRPLPKHDALHPLGLPSEQTQGRYPWRRVSVPTPLGSVTSGQIALALAEQAFLHNDAPGPVRVHLPTDLRPYARRERSTANLFGSLFLEVDPSMTADAVGLAIVRMLYEREGQRPAGLYAGHETGSLAAHRVKAFLDLHHLHATGRYAFSATVSHLGKLDSASLSAPDFRASTAFFVPLVGDACVVSVNGFDDHVEVAVGVGDRFDQQGQLRRLAEAMEQALG